MTTVHVAAAVIVNGQGEVLIAKRPQDKHQGGLWEFPGGKLEAGEDVQSALARELHEEIGIDVTHCRPLITVAHDYPDKSVLLDVWKVDGFSGEAHGREGQPVEWVAPARLREFDFPAANRPIVAAAQLPDRYMVTPEPDPDKLEDFLQRLEHALLDGVRLLQFRAKRLSPELWQQHAKAVIELCDRYAAKCLLNGSVEDALGLAAHGVHLDSKRLYAYHERPVDESRLLVASCHNREDLQQAEVIGADFVVLSPVKATASHPEAVPLGWDSFHEMVGSYPVPVFALGGMHVDDLEEAFAAGAQGIAAIRSLWPPG